MSIVKELLDFNSLKCGIVVAATCFWFWFYQSDCSKATVLGIQLPEVKGKLEKAATENVLRVNGTALAHSLIIIPLALLMVLLSSEDRITDANDNARSVLVLTSLFSSGYFLWDLFICLSDFKEFGMGFFIHGAICTFSALYISFDPYTEQCPYLLGWIMLTETSTPFLYLRWGFLKARVVDTAFHITNGVFITVFLLLRIVLANYFSSVPRLLDLYRVVVQGKPSSFYQVTPVPTQMCMGVINIIWTLLQIGWISTVISNLLFQKKKERAAKKN